MHFCVLGFDIAGAGPGLRGGLCRGPGRRLGLQRGAGSGAAGLLPGPAQREGGPVLPGSTPILAPVGLGPQLSPQGVCE